MLQNAISMYHFIKQILKQYDLYISIIIFLQKGRIMLILHVHETIIQNRLSIGLEPSGKIFQNNLLQLFNLTWIGYKLHSLDSILDCIQTSSLAKGFRSMHPAFSFSLVKGFRSTPLPIFASQGVSVHYAPHMINGDRSGSRMAYGICALNFLFSLKVDIGI